MRTGKGLMLVGLGVVIGAVMGGWTQSASATQNVPARMESTRAGFPLLANTIERTSPGYPVSVQFLRDTVSGACWILTSSDNRGDALAVAPPTACNGLHSK